MDLRGFIDTTRATAAFLAEAGAETLWPTRCVICDMPGALVCTECALRLPYLDALYACPTCGAAYGIQECTECNSFTLHWKGLVRLPVDGCASACMLSAESRRIATAFKDRGEMRLAHFMAYLMAACIPPAWLEANPAIVPIPSRKAAVRQRGFDHMHLLARELQSITELPLEEALRARPTRDQRALDARQRLLNMQGSIEVKRTPTPRCALLIDDVYTTGATLFAAADALRGAGTETVYALTFIRA